MTEVLTVKDLVKVYAQEPAVAGISFSVKTNEIVGLLGPNGAGKTTTINMILGVLKATSGEIKIENMDINKNRGAAMRCTNFAAVYAPLPGNLTVYQNLKIFGLIYGIKNLKSKIENLLEQFDLKNLRNRKCGVLSSGEQTRVSLAKAMLNNPHLLLLDEPTASLDPSTARDLRLKIKAFSGGGILWTSHNMLEVEEMCDRVLFLSKGKILLEGNPKTLAKEHRKKNLEELFITVAREPLSLNMGAGNAR